MSVSYAINLVIPGKLASKILEAEEGQEGCEVGESSQQGAGIAIVEEYDDSTYSSALALSATRVYQDVLYFEVEALTQPPAILNTPLSKRPKLKEAFHSR